MNEEWKDIQSNTQDVKICKREKRQNKANRRSSYF